MSRKQKKHARKLARESHLRTRLEAAQAELDDLRELHACDLSLLKRESERCDRYAGVVAGLGVQVRYDHFRPEGQKRWTAWVAGRGRGDGHTPREAAEALARSLGL